MRTSILQKQWCGPGSGRIYKILPDPDFSPSDPTPKKQDSGLTNSRVFPNFCTKKRFSLQSSVIYKKKKVIMHKYKSLKWVLGFAFWIWIRIFSKPDLLQKVLLLNVPRRIQKVGIHESALFVVKLWRVALVFDPNIGKIGGFIDPQAEDSQIFFRYRENNFKYKTSFS
jgi:hypothetical protein